VILLPAFILLNGLFVAAEFALIGAPKMTIEQQAGAGNRLAARLLDLLGSSANRIGTLRPRNGITVASLGLGMFAEHELTGIIAHALPSFLHRNRVYRGRIGAAALTFLHIVFGEMVPKRSRSTPQRAARWALAHVGHRLCSIRSFASRAGSPRCSRGRRAPAGGFRSDLHRGGTPADRRERAGGALRAESGGCSRSCSRSATSRRPRS
jgi:hypothetical protein